MPWILGIDPGVRPTLVRIIDEPGQQIAADCWDCDDTSIMLQHGQRKLHRPSAPLLRHCMVEAMPNLVVIEQVGSHPGEGVSSTFHFGFASGMLEGVAVGLQLQVIRVAPQVWKGAFRFPANASKDYSRHVASNIAPHLTSLWAKKTQHHRADAFLMAYWARSQVGRV